MDFQPEMSYTPKGDQPRAIDELLNGVTADEKLQVLLGVTGSGKTFTMARRTALPVLSSRQRLGSTNL